MNITNRWGLSQVKLRNHISVSDNLQHLVSFMLVQIVFPLDLYLEEKGFTNQIVDSSRQKIRFLNLLHQKRKDNSYTYKKNLGFTITVLRDYIITSSVMGPVSSMQGWCKSWSARLSNSRNLVSLVWSSTTTCNLYLEHKSLTYLKLK